MRTYNLSKIEKNIKFKNYLSNKNIWKNYAFVPPALILFIGLFGLIYLYKENILISWRSVPFIIIFTLGTIWFKATRKYFLDRKKEKIKSILICTTTILVTTKQKYIILFTTNNNRHNQSYIDRKKEEILEKLDFTDNSLLDQIKKNKFTSINDNDLFIAQSSYITRKYPVAIINNESLFFIKTSNLPRFSK